MQDEAAYGDDIYGVYSSQYDYDGGRVMLVDDIPKLGFIEKEIERVTQMQEFTDNQYGSSLALHMVDGTFLPRMGQTRSRP